MKLSERAAFQFYEPRPGMWDFFRCLKCNAIFTYEEERVRLLRMRTTDDKQMLICCTSKKYQPAFPVWREWLRPNVLKYTIKLLLARGLAPWAEERCNWLLHVIEPLVANETTR